MNNKNESTLPITDKNDQIVPDEVKVRSAEFKLWQRFWYIIHYTVGIIAIFSSGFAAASGTEIGGPVLFGSPWLWGLMATAFASIVTFLGPLSKGEAYKNAYYLLHGASARYKKGLMDMDDLLNALDDAQSIVLMGAATRSTRNSKIPS